jgi:hypothetical protein
MATERDMKIFVEREVNGFPASSVNWLDNGREHLKSFPTRRHLHDRRDIIVSSYNSSLSSMLNRIEPYYPVHHFKKKPDVGTPFVHQFLAESDTSQSNNKRDNNLEETSYRNDFEALNFIPLDDENDDNFIPDDDMEDDHDNDDDRDSYEIFDFES